MRHLSNTVLVRTHRSKFTDDEVKVFRKRVESGKVTVSRLGTRGTTAGACAAMRQGADGGPALHASSAHMDADG